VVQQRSGETAANSQKARSAVPLLAMDFMFFVTLWFKKEAVKPLQIHKKHVALYHS